MNIFSFDKRILPEYHIRDVVLSSSMARPMKLRYTVLYVQQGFPSKTTGVIFLIVVTNGYVLVTPLGA